MLKLLKKLLAGDSDEHDSAENTLTPTTKTDTIESIIAKADKIWHQGKFGQALALYRQAIQQNPESTKLREHIITLLKQHRGIAESYEKLAIELKEQGKIEQATTYYRQAVELKALTGDTRNKILKPNFTNGKNKFPIINLKDTAFSFQPLAQSSALVRQTPVTSLAVPDRGTQTADDINSALSNISQEQAQNVKWEAAQVYLQQALEYCEQQQWQAAALTAQQAIAIVPELAEAYKIKGNALQRMGKTAEAMEYYIKAVEIKPNLAEVYGGIGDVYAKQQQWQAAVEYYQKATIIKPTAELYRNLAHALTQVGDLETAKINTRKAARLESPQTRQLQKKDQQTSTVNNSTIKRIAPSNTQDSKIETYRQIAQQLEQQSRWQEASIYYRQALKLSMSYESRQLPPLKNLELLKPNKTKRLPNLSPTESQIDKAIRRYQKQASNYPNSVKIFTDLGNLYTKKRLWQSAIAAYQQAIRINHKYPQARLNLARVYAKLGKHSEFVEQIEAVLLLKPDIATAIDLFNFGNALIKQRRRNLARRYYEQAIVQDRHLRQAYYRLGELLNEQNKHQEAVAVYQQAVEHNPEEADFYYLLGQQLVILKQWDKAVKSYTKVLELQPRFPQAPQKLNHALAEKLRLDLEAKRR